LRSLIKKYYNIKETRGVILSEEKSYIDAGLRALEKHRSELEEYCESNPLFEYSFRPLELAQAPISAIRMSLASREADVGPMAAVAGVLADLSVEAMLECGAKIAVVENGGEISMSSKKPVSIAIAAGEAELSREIGFRVEDFPSGIATSSGRHSHALSFGDSDAVTVFAKNAGLADAVATSLGNMVVNNKEATLQKVLSQGLTIVGVQGVLILIDGNVGMCGKLPKLINLKENNREKIDHNMVQTPSCKIYPS
jgi:hypothetical protein